MSMAAVMSQMPDVIRRTLAEHVADGQGRCRACRNAGGEQAWWPCQTFKVAHHAHGIATGELPLPDLRSVREPWDIGEWPLDQRSSRENRRAPEPRGGDGAGWRRPEPEPWNRPARDDRRGRFDDRPSWSDDRHHEADRPDPRSAPSGPRAFTPSYGSTVDAPYGSSFGVDDGPRRHRRDH